MLQKTKLTLLRLFAVIAFVALFVFASISLASCSSESSRTVTKMEIVGGYLYVTYSDSEEAENLGYVNGADGYEGSDGDNGVGISSITLDEATGELVITYDNDDVARVDISGYITSVVDSELAKSECNHEYEDVMIIQAKDCGHDGLTLQRCVNCNNAIVVDDPATGNHTYDYDAIVWKWADDYSATVTVTCTTCGATGGTNGVVTVDATVESVVTTPATCDETGLMTYTATATLPDGNEYTDTVTAVIPTISVHIYVNSTTGDKTYIVMTEDGTYPAYVYIVDGTDYVMTGDEDPATYEELCDIFGADHLMVTDCEAGASLISQNAELVCSVCGEDFHGVTPAFNHSISETATIETHYDNGVAASMTPTCTDKGYYDEVYYCTVCGYEETRNTVEVAALGHNYVADTENGWTWTPVYDGTEITGYEATLSFICSVCRDVHTETATVTSVHTSLTCQDNEADTYTATVTYEGLIYTTTHEVVTKYAIGYHTATSGLTFVLVDNFIYEYDTTLGKVSADAMTVSEFLAAGGTMLTYGGEENISYGYIYCTTCVSGTTTKVTVSLPKGGHHYAAVPETVDGKVSDVTWVWSADYSEATVYITCIDCGYVDEKGFTATVAVEPNQNGTGYIYTATYTYYGEQIFTDEVEIVTANANEAISVPLNATTTSYVAQVKIVTNGYYAIEFNSTAAVITVTGSNGETYTTATASAVALSKAAVVLEETSTATVNYIVDKYGNPAIIPADTILYISIELIDTTVADDFTVSYTVATAADPTMTIGEAFGVTIGDIDSDTWWYETSVTVTTAGYYKVTLTGATDDVYISIYDYNYNYNYDGSTDYIIAYSNLIMPVSVAADTVLYVTIYNVGDEDVAISLLIELDTAYVSDVTAITLGTATTITDDDVYSFTATEDGKYIFSVDTDGHIEIYDSNLEYVSEADGGETTVKLTAGETVYIANAYEFSYTTWEYTLVTPSTVTVTIKEPVVINYTDYYGIGYIYNVSSYAGTTASNGTALIEDVLTVNSGTSTLYINTDCTDEDSFAIGSGTVVYTGVDLSSGILISNTARYLTFVLSADADVTFYYGLGNANSVFVVYDKNGDPVYTDDAFITDTDTYTILSGTVSLEAGTYTIGITGGNIRLYSIAAIVAPAEAVPGNPYNGNWVEFEISGVTTDIRTLTVYNNGVLVEGKNVFWYGDSSNGVIHAQIMYSSDLTEVPTTYLEWYDAEGNVVFTALYNATYTIEHEGESVANADPGTYYVYYVGDYQWWDDWSLTNSTDVTATYDTGTITWTVANNTFTSDYWWANQLFYKNSDLTEGTVYALSLTIESTAAGDITVNGTVYTLEVGTNEIVAYYTETTGASLSIQLGVYGYATTLGACTLTISDVTWTEATTTTYEFSLSELATAIEEATETTATDKTQLYDSYFTGSNEFLTLETVDEQDESVYRTSGNGCIQIKGAGLSVNFNYTGSITITFASTGGSNTSSIALVDSDGNYITASSTTATPVNVYDEEGETVIGTYYTVTGVSYISITFNVTSAGKYYITTNLGTENRAARIQTITMTDYIVAEAE